MNHLIFKKYNSKAYKEFINELRFQLPSNCYVKFVEAYVYPSHIELVFTRKGSASKFSLKHGNYIVIDSSLGLVDVFGEDDLDNLTGNYKQDPGLVESVFMLTIIKEPEAKTGIWPTQKSG